MTRDNETIAPGSTAETPVVTYATVSPLAATPSRPLSGAEAPAPLAAGEPVPDRLMQLARELEEALAARKFPRLASSDAEPTGTGDEALQSGADG
ncbi:hypothetical protein [Methylobrevis albus]|uniref:Uncharacterized protein n=1 Tax=Methylobrevis albus TaxID=2793297 RepID=A0A931I1G5_9HYPH|nr:hypothetical protein [Methylobrevis albus]MBH0237528.1 hypothetical protein [Methylobrevis albus]